MPDKRATQVAIPWRRPRHELLLLLLVAAAVFLPVYALNPQDQARICLALAIPHGHLWNDRCLESSIDRSAYNGHLYSDKAPGLSLVEIPVAEAVRLPPPNNWPSWSLRFWAIRITTSGIAFLALAFMVGRVSEGLAPGFGAPSLVTFALGTLVAPFAASGFDHVPAAALGFAAFLLAWRRRPLAAGVAAGSATFVEYEASLVLVVIAAYIALNGARALMRYTAGAAPPLMLLAGYDWLAFGAPWHLSYRYIANSYAVSQTAGFFGIRAPHLYSAFAVFSGSRGLLVVSPVLVAAVWGLALIRRSYLAEACVAAAIGVLFVFLNCGYFLPYGGVSAGPRFLIPALPFLALGLGPAFAWRTRLCALLALVSVVATTALMLVWPELNAAVPLRHSIWAAIGTRTWRNNLTPTLLHWLDAAPTTGAAVVGLVALAAFAVAWSSVRPMRERRPGRTIAVVASLYLAVAALACGVAAYPYSDRLGTGAGVGVSDLVPSIVASKTSAFPGDEVDFVVTVTEPSAAEALDVVLEIRLAAGLQLLGPPAYERGSGCKGSVTIDCNLDFIEGRHSTPIRFGVRLTAAPPLTVTATAFSQGAASYRRASFTVARPSP